MCCVDNADNFEPRVIKSCSVYLTSIEVIFKSFCSVLVTKHHPR